MKISHSIRGIPSRRILPVIFALLFAFCVGPAHSASEPGTVTIVLSGEPINLDSGDSTRSIHGQILRKNVVECLTDINPDDSRIIPKLADSWKQIDPHTWHFFLRKGVKFHDGADFNAQAVLFNIKRIYDKKIDSNTRVKFFSNFTLEGRALDSHTVELKTGTPEPLLPTYMSILAICSPNTPMQLARTPIGTGPFKFVKWDAGMQVILERFDGYWGKQPQAKKAIYVWRNESAVRASMVLIGEADLAPGIARQDANRPEMDISYFNSETAHMRIGGEWVPPLNDRRVRMALNLAVDRNGIRGTVLSKDVLPATQPMVPSIFGHNPDLKVWPYDPRKARQLLDEARKEGVPVDKEILLVGRFDIYPGAEELMETLMTMYKAVGLNVKLKMTEGGVYRPYDNKPYTPGPYILQKQSDNSRGDAAFSAFGKYHCKGNQSSTCDKEVDGLIEKAQVATGEERRNLWRVMFKRVHEEIIPDVMLFHMVGYARVGKRINFKPTLETVNEIPLIQIIFKQ